jgi:hypothetical protein
MRKGVTNIRVGITLFVADQLYVVCIWHHHLGEYYVRQNRVGTRNQKILFGGTSMKQSLSYKMNILSGD